MTGSTPVSFGEILSGEFRWPQQGDNPLSSAASPESSGYVELPADATSRAYFISTGFMRAAEILAQNGLSNRWKRLELVFPSLFCFRHAIEVALKRLLTQYTPAFGVQCKMLNSTHDLTELWHCFVALMDVTSYAGDAEGITAAGEVVRCFASWDSRSFAFRYPTTTQGEDVVFPEESIDLENLIDVMRGFANFLTGVDAQLHEFSTYGP